MKRYYHEAMMAALLLGAISLACSDDGQTGPAKDLWSGKLDQPLIKYDYGKGADWWVPPKHDGGSSGDGYKPSDAGIKDGSSGDGGKDSGPLCSLPSGVTCSPTCTSGKLCAAAKGGMCATEVVVTGPASGKKALAAVTAAHATCWAKNSKVDTLCSTLNTCSMTGTMTVDMMKNWVCKIAKSGDFPSATLFSKAKDLCGCAMISTNNTDWKITITGGGKAKICLSYDYSSWWTDYIHVNQCANFPPK